MQTFDDVIDGSGLGKEVSSQNPESRIKRKNGEDETDTKFSHRIRVYRTPRQQKERVRAIGHVGRGGIVLSEALDIARRSLRRKQRQSGIAQRPAPGAGGIGRERPVVRHLRVDRFEARPQRASDLAREPPVGVHTLNTLSSREL